MRRICVVVEYTLTHVKTRSKLSNLGMKSLIKEYSGELGSNSRRNKGNFKISLEFNQIRQ